MKTSALSVLLFLSFPASAQLFLDNRQLLAFPGTYGNDISLPADAELRIYGTGDYVLSGVLRDERGQASRLSVAAGNGRLLLTGLNAYTGVGRIERRRFSCLSGYGEARRRFVVGGQRED